MSYLKPGGALLQAESISFLVLYIIFLFQHLFYVIILHFPSCWGGVGVQEIK